jgi:hypothetical protein
MRMGAIVVAPISSSWVIADYDDDDDNKKPEEKK